MRANCGLFYSPSNRTTLCRVFTNTAYDDTPFVLLNSHLLPSCLCAACSTNILFSHNMFAVVAICAQHKRIEYIVLEYIHTVCKTRLTDTLCTFSVCVCVFFLLVAHPRRKHKHKYVMYLYRHAKTNTILASYSCCCVLYV